MKLLRCHKCHDVVALTMKWKCCECGDASGRYLLDHRTVLVSLGAELFAIPNSKTVDVISFYIRTEDTKQPDEMFADKIDEFWDNDNIGSNGTKCSLCKV